MREGDEIRLSHSMIKLNWLILEEQARTENAKRKDKDEV